MSQTLGDAKESTVTTIIVDNHEATLTNDPHLFVGTTGEGRFPPLGTDEEGFSFAPAEASFGTLVFDLKQENERRPTTSKFYRYWWQKGRLVVQLGLKRLPREFLYDTYGGIYHLATEPDYQGAVIYSPYGQMRNNVTKVVPLLDLIRFFEGKIELKDVTVIKLLDED